MWMTSSVHRTMDLGKISGLLNSIGGFLLYPSTAVAQSPAQTQVTQKLEPAIAAAARCAQAHRGASGKWSCPKNQVTSASPFHTARVWKMGSRRRDPVVRLPGLRRRATLPSPRTPAASPSVSSTASNATATETIVGSLCCSSCRKESR